MDITVEFNEAAFNHNYTKEDIYNVFETARYDGKIEEEDEENKYLVIGFDRKTRLSEVMYNVIDDDTINVFHAMKCRNKWLHLIKTGG